MRNLKEYPVTTQEIVEILTKMSDEILEEGRCGDMRPIALTIAARIVRRADFTMSALGEIDNG